MNADLTTNAATNSSQQKQYSTACSFLLCAKQTLDAYGLDGGRLLAEAGIPTEKYITSKAMLPITTIGKSWQVVANSVDDPAIGVRAASKYFSPVHWQSLGLALLCSTSLRNALERVVRYFTMLSDAAVIELREDKSCLMFIGHPLCEPEKIGYEAMEFGLMALLTLLREIFTDGKLNPIEIRLTRPTHSSHPDFAQLFGCPVSFGSEYELMSFDLSIVDRALPASNQSLAEYQDSYSEEFVKLNCNTNFKQSVKICVSQLLPGGEPTLMRVAKTLGISERSLQRKLSAELTSFRELFLETRKEMALRHIEQDRHSLVEIAYLLSFSDHSNFSRAFKQWTGLSPTDYKKKIKSDSSSFH